MYVRVVLIKRKQTILFLFLPPTLLSNAPSLETYFCQILLGAGHNFRLCSTHSFVGQWLTIFEYFVPKAKNPLNFLYTQMF